MASESSCVFPGAARVSAFMQSYCRCSTYARSSEPQAVWHPVKAYDKRHRLRREHIIHIINRDLTC
eukprot:6434934-Pyramimonas_sp.AAC.1